MAKFINTVDAIGDEALTNRIIDRSITEFNDDYLTTMGEYAFYKCTSLTSVNLPNITKISSNGFSYCSNLESADLAVATYLYYVAFGYSAKLKTLILRNTTKICSMSATSALDSTLIASGTGYIYVPRCFLSDDDATKDYRRKTNWSTYASQFRALEDYTVDGTTTGELDPTKI